MKAILNAWKRISMSFTVDQSHKRLVIVVLSLLCKKFISIYVGVLSLTSSNNHVLKLFPVVGFKVRI